MKKSKALGMLLGARNVSRLPVTLVDIAKLNLLQMMERGVSEYDAKKILCAIDLAREIAEPETPYPMRITSPIAAMQYCKSEFKALANHAVQEEFWIVTLDTKNQPINKHQVTVGTLRNSLVHPREVFRPAIADAANCFLCVHNHPSGDPTPSDQDISVTERLEQAAEIIGIPMIDHIVVAGDKALSIQEWRSGNRW
jgi:DNA repair protein RadC